MSDSFVSLHNHSSYSTLDGAAKVSEFVGRAKELGMPGLGITDHGNLSGIIDFYKECKKQDINPCLGIEAYFTDDRKLKAKPETKHGDLDGSDKRYYHLTLLAENNTGYHNLIRASSDAYLNGYYYKPRMDWDSLSDYHEGLIAATGCLGGPVLQPLLHDDYRGALEAAGRLQDIFGPENLFVEMMDHGLPEQAKTNPELVSIAKKLNAPLITTLDCHYTHEHDSVAHDSLLCIQTSSMMSDPSRFKFNGSGYYLQNPSDVREKFKDNPSACDNTLLINDRCNVEIGFDTMHLPKFDVPPEYGSDFDYLESLAFRGLLAKIETPSKEYYDRLTYELGVIKSMGVSSYFLIFWDIVEFCKREGIMYGPGRGSAAGCLVSYVLGVTKIDPLEYNLIFERFLNPGRIALPDIDFDVEQRFREKVINYTKHKYGDDRVAQIITYTTIKARSAVRDATRVLGYDFAVGDKISKAMPPLIAGFDTPLYACMNKAPSFEAGYAAAQDLREMYKADPDVQKIVDVALGLEGLHRATGIHAAGVVIGDDVLTENLPLLTTEDKTTKERVVVTQWDKDTIEDAGFLKMDFLGLATLDVISNAIDMIPEMSLEDLDDLPLDDPITFNLFKSADTVGVFQVGESGMRALLQRVSPDNIKDISAVLALYRPGPMSANMHNDFADRKHGLQPAIPFHPDAQEILADTYQLAIFQEEILFIAQKFAGYDLSEADMLRKILGKKLKDQMIAERKKFESGCVAQGYDQAFASDLFNMIEGFSMYSFNASHSLGYSFISYWTAYLKANYRREFMASLCSSVMGNHEKTAVYLTDCVRSGLEVKPPDVNESEKEYTVTENGIRVGLNLVRNIGGALADSIISERKANGPYRGVPDLCVRVPEINSKALVHLAGSGALDSFGYTRQGLTAASKEILQSLRKQKKKIESGQDSLFTVDDIPNREIGIDISPIEYEHPDLLRHEKTSLGFYFSGHPVDDYETTPLTLEDIKYATSEKKYLEVVVLVSGLKTKRTKKGEAMALLTVEDKTAELEFVCFPKSWAKFMGTFGEGAVIKAFVRTGTDFRDEKNYILEGVEVIDTRDEDLDYNRKVGFYLPEKMFRDEDFMSRLKGLFISHPGHYMVECYISRSTVIDLGQEYKVTPSDDLFESYKTLIQEHKKGNKHE